MKGGTAEGKEEGGSVENGIGEGGRAGLLFGCGARESRGQDGKENNGFIVMTIIAFRRCRQRMRRERMRSRR